MRSNYILAIILLLGSFILVGCKPEWTSDEKTDFLNGCESEARSHGNRNPKGYCNCMMEKLMVGFPEHDFEEMEPDSMMAYSAACREATSGKAVVWPENSEGVFLTNCYKLANEQKKKDPKGWCKCLLENVKTHFPNSDDLATINPDSMMNLSIACDSLLK